VEPLPFADIPATTGQPPADALGPLQSLLAPWAPQLEVALWLVWSALFAAALGRTLIVPLVARYRAK
jgi:hypothetical protein